MPLYLALLGILFSWRSCVRKALGGLAVLIVSVALITFLDYSVWGVSTGRFWTPDYKTVLIVRTAGEIALLIALVPPLVTLLVRYIRQHDTETPNQAMERTATRSGSRLKDEL